MKGQTKAIGQETMTTETIGSKPVLDFPNPVFTCATSVVKDIPLLRPTALIGQHKINFLLAGVMLRFDQHTTPFFPVLGSIENAGEAYLGALLLIVGLGRTLHQGLRQTLQNYILG